ncbi:hypothetical protein BO99DRAFT_263124 [Aspergillus violaceofuscus CBS 115571]|uniref:Uncharacterized protein n=1 Tax=Aspergillus violaceofuscus (strain CBS 115571) TaxID=1450538 RepID=A0A2V5HGP9_ASPV1|nr:hypothetical protein BO99DRAFT_263124 [Aspergillus violaceofuscus CBS 115571]
MAQSAVRHDMTPDIPSDRGSRYLLLRVTYHLASGTQWNATFKHMGNPGPENTAPNSPRFEHDKTTRINNCFLYCSVALWASGFGVGVGPRIVRFRGGLAVQFGRLAICESRCLV